MTDGGADFVVVDVDVLVGRVEEVAQHGDGTSCLLENELGAFLCLLHFRDGLVPPAHEHLHFGIEFGDTLSFSHRTDDHSEVLGRNALYELLEARALLSASDFR